MDIYVDNMFNQDVEEQNNGKEEESRTDILEDQKEGWLQIVFMPNSTRELSPWWCIVECSPTLATHGSVGTGSDRLTMRIRFRLR
jgi:hypothetical protein